MDAGHAIVALALMAAFAYLARFVWRVAKGRGSPCEGCSHSGECGGSQKGGTDCKGPSGDA